MIPLEGEPPSPFLSFHEKRRLGQTARARAMGSLRAWLAPGDVHISGINSNDYKRNILLRSLDICLWLSLNKAVSLFGSLPL